MRKKVIIFAQGIGPIKNSFGKFLTKNILKNCSYISVRDEKSQKLLNSWGIKADLLCDPIFSTHIQPVNKTNTVAVQLRDFKTMSDDFIDRLAQKIVKEFSDKNIEIFSFQESIDLDVCKKFEKAVNMLNSDIKTELHHNLTNDEIIKKLSQAEYLIAMRFHALIIGLLSATKVLGINYDIKVEKLAKEFKFPVIDLKKEFKNEFEELKIEQIDKISQKVSNKTFDWKRFEQTISA